MQIQRLTCHLFKPLKYYPIFLQKNFSGFRKAPSGQKDSIKKRSAFCEYEIQTINEVIYSPLKKFQIPDFLNIQRSSFKEFLKIGLIEEIKKYNLISNSDQTIEIFFYADYYKLKRPKLSPKQAILKRKSYTCQLYIPIQLSNRMTEQIHIQWVLLANLPLMTDHGHFILNGSPRVLMNQIVRSPGVYFQKTLNSSQKLIYCADFIAKRGAWLRLEVDTKKGDIWVKLKRTPKISIVVFLRALGLNLPLFNNSIDFVKLRYFLQLKKQTKGKLVRLNLLGPGINNSLTISEFQILLKKLKDSYKRKSDNDPKKRTKPTPVTWSKDYLCTTNSSSLYELSTHLYPNKNSLEGSHSQSQKFLFRKFLNSRMYDLSTLGRSRINKKLGVSIPLKHTVLTAQDILFASLFLMDLLQGFISPDDIDDLKNRKIKPSGELIQVQLTAGLIRLDKTLRDKLNQPPQKGESLEHFFNSKQINQAFREFFGTSPLSQLMDQTNPLSELTHKRRLSSLGPGGINRETAGMAIRGIHPTHYGRICPIETPEGQNAGLVNSFTTCSHLNSHGFIETPFYKTYKGFILKTKNPFLFTSDQEENNILAPGDIKVSRFGFLPPGISLPSRQLKEFKRAQRNQVNFVAVSPIQMISVATSLIPFLEHNDGNRALMGSNMQRQAVPTIRPSKPIVGTGLESRVISDVGHALQAKKSGFVSYVDGKKIIIYSNQAFAETGNFQNGVQTERLRLKKRFVVPKDLSTDPKELFGNAKSFSFKKLEAAKLNLFLSMRLKKREGRYYFRQRLVDLGKSTIFPPQKTTLANFSSDSLFFAKKPNTPLQRQILTELAIFDYFSPLKKQFFELNKYNFINAPTKFSPFYSFPSIQPLDLTNKNKNQINTKQLSLIYNCLFKNDFQGQLQLARVSKLSLGSFSLKILSHFSHERLLLAYCQKILSARKLKVPLNTLTLKLIHKKTLPCFKGRIKNQRRRQAQNPFWSNVVFNYYSSSLFPMFFFGTCFESRIKILDSFSTFLVSKSCFFNQQKGFKLQTLPFQRNFKTKSFLLSHKIKNRGSLRKKRKPNTRCNKRQKFLPSFGLKQKFQGCTAVNKTEFERTLLKETNFPNLNLLENASSFFVLKQTFLTSSKSYFVDKRKKTSIKFLKLFLQTERKMPGLHCFLKLDSAISESFNFQNRPSQLKQTLLNQRTQSRYKFQKALKRSKYSLFAHLIPQEYLLTDYHRSNQDTLMVQRPIISEGQWVEKGDILADSSASMKGELALGQNILVGYTPWEGYNFEDAVLISERLISDDLYTSIHIERYEVEVRDTKFGLEQITNQIPSKTQENSYLDNNGLAKVGTWVTEGDILVGKVAPLGQKKLTPYENLLYDIIGKEIPRTRDTSLRVPKGVNGRVIHIEIVETNGEKRSAPLLKKKIRKPLGSKLKPISQTLRRFSRNQKNFSHKFEKLLRRKTPFGLKIDSPSKIKTVIFKLTRTNSSFRRGFKLETSESNNRLVKIHPKIKIWKQRLKQRSDYESQFFTKKEKIHQQILQTKTSSSSQSTFYFSKRLKKRFFLLQKAKLLSSTFQSLISQSQALDSEVLISSGLSLQTLATEQYSFSNKNLSFSHKSNSLNSTSPNKKIDKRNLFASSKFFTKQKTVSHPSGKKQSSSSWSNKSQISFNSVSQLNKNFSPSRKAPLRFLGEKLFSQVRKPTSLPEPKFLSPLKIQIYVAEKRKLQLGDKIAGRHGNKGIISNILPRPDMPYLPDGRPLDIVLNPLGVPSRMNVGQIFECLLGLAGYYLNQNYKIQPFDEIYGCEASRSFVYSKLYEARIKTGQKWLFNPNFPGKTRLFDGRSGECFEQPVTVGVAYILKLVHLVDDKIHARSTGPYSLVTQQPLRGRSKQGGQRVGEMEVWALEGFGAAYILQEILTIKSDDLKGRDQILQSILKNTSMRFDIPESFKVLVRELQSLCLDISIYKNGTKQPTKMNIRQFS